MTVQSAVTPLAAAVIAGGMSRRMGRDKASLLFEGGSLVGHQLGLLRALDPAELVLSCRPDVDYGIGGDVRTVHDRSKGTGPLGGLDALLSATVSPHLLVIAVDMPFLTAEFLSRIASARGEGIGVVPRGASGLEPLAAVYPRKVADLVRSRLSAGRLSMRGLAEEALAAGRLREWRLDASEERFLFNWNEGDLPPS